MRIKPLSERAIFWIQFPFIAPIVFIATVWFLPLVPFIWLVEKFFEWNNERKRAKGWHLWFAWRPVSSRGFYYDRDDMYAWLETI